MQWHVYVYWFNLRKPWCKHGTGVWYWWPPSFGAFSWCHCLVLLHKASSELDFVFFFNLLKVCCYLGIQNGKHLH